MSLTYGTALATHRNDANRKFSAYDNRRTPQRINETTCKCDSIEGRGGGHSGRSDGDGRRSGRCGRFGRVEVNRGSKYAWFI